VTAVQSPPTVYLVDDQSAVRASFLRWLEESVRFRVVGDAGDARVAIREIRSTQPDLVLLDVAIPGLSGLDALPLILQANPRGKVVMLTNFDSAGLVRLALARGATGFLSKSDEPAEIVAGLTRIAAGEPFVSPRARGVDLIARTPRNAPAAASEAPEASAVRVMQQHTPAQSESWFRALIDGAPDAIVGVDKAGRIAVVNAETERLFGYQRGDLLGQAVEILVPERFRRGHVQERERYTASPSMHPLAIARHLTGRKKDGSEFPVEISLSPVRTPEGVLVVGAIRDVTDRKAAERRELTMLRALATIGESAAILAHEIKNPLTAVNAALKTVGARLGLADREVLDDLVERMRRLETMIRRTLSFVKPLELHRKSLSATDLFKHAVADSRGALWGKAIEIRNRAASGLSFPADPQLMREVVANLVTNAAEALDAKRGTIELRAERLTSAGEVVLTVEDDGPGLPASMQGRPIQPFVTSKKTGTGLGLTICRRIVEEHGGTIEIHPGRHRGTRVRIALPDGSGPRPDV
jgi:protein-histidine pros-kinase